MTQRQYRPRWARWLVAVSLAGGALSACVAGDDETVVEPPIPDVPPEDLMEVPDIKGDGSFFDAELLIDDATFGNELFMSEGEIQAFFESTPYGSRSFLADARFGGKLASRHVAESALTHRINPLVLLVKLQVETGLVSKTVAPAQRTIDRAMGCGCPDGGHCSSVEAGFAQQVDCAGELFRSYLDDLDTKGQTIAGWRVGHARRTLDPQWVTPRSRATAALYTYTPWVLRNQGGNWLYWNVQKRYSRAILEGRPNHHWVGGPCASGAQCAVDAGVCLAAPGGGLCSAPCDRFCPDSSAPFTSTTFCADLGSHLGGAPAGYCVSRCNTDLYAGEGCRPGFHCELSARHGDPSVSLPVCLPDR